jgi:hypothetical protein
LGVLVTPDPETLIAEWEDAGDTIYRFIKTGDALAAALAASREREYRRVLLLILHYPFDVNSTAEWDLAAVKELAQEVLAASSDGEGGG